jgi:hypothetical protein
VPDEWRLEQERKVRNKQKKFVGQDDWEEATNIEFVVKSSE